MIEHLIVDEPHVLVRANATVPCIIVQLRAFANRSQFKGFMNAGLAYYVAQARPTQRWGWIAGTRHMSAIPQEVQQWLAEDWNARAFQAGLREMSIVTAINRSGRLATQQYAEKVRAGVRALRVGGEAAGAYVPGPRAPRPGPVADNRLRQALRQADLQWNGDLVFKGLSDWGAAASRPWIRWTP